MRYLWIAAIDGLLALPQEELERRVVAYEMMARKDFDRLTSTPPGECGQVVSEWAAEFAASLRIGASRHGDSERRVQSA